MGHFFWDTLYHIFAFAICNIIIMKFLNKCVKNKHHKNLRFHRRGFQLITQQFYLSRDITFHVTFITTILCHVSLIFSDGRLYCNSIYLLETRRKQNVSINFPWHKYLQVKALSRFIIQFLQSNNFKNLNSISFLKI